MIYRITEAIPTYQHPPRGQQKPPPATTEDPKWQGIPLHTYRARRTPNNHGRTPDRPTNQPTTVPTSLQVRDPNETPQPAPRTSTKSHRHVQTYRQTPSITNLEHPEYLNDRTHRYPSDQEREVSEEDQGDQEDQDTRREASEAEEDQAEALPEAPQWAVEGDPKVWDPSVRTETAAQAYQVVTAAQDGQEAPAVQAAQAVQEVPLAPMDGGESFLSNQEETITTTTTDALRLRKTEKTPGTKSTEKQNSTPVNQTHSQDETLESGNRSSPNSS